MITCIVQARMSSERLPGKVLKPILGKPMVLHVLDRLSKSQTIDTIVLATSTDSSNDPLVECVEQAGYKTFRGSEDNVLERFIQTIELHCQSPDFSRKSEQASASSPGPILPPDRQEQQIIVRITADCPLLDPEIVDRVITRFINEDLDYIRLDVPQSFIRGFDVEVFSYDALLKTAECADDPKYQEHVTYYIYTHQDQFKVGFERGTGFYNKDYRLCVDSPSDLELVTNIFEHFNDPFISAEKVVEYLDNNPELVQINNDSHQKTV